MFVNAVQHAYLLTYAKLHYETILINSIEYDFAMSYDS